ncbi:MULTISPECIES: NAD-dependent epimerase/dehydratase family protein [Flammeovirga]|uniref:NAD-dependent epimerase/dehydratase family protein n=1 Tax=Flammeovirga agarivorans TaxID=2726742 RepID=A0A7X8SPE0_9BACT|nr:MULTISPECIES: NAD-dependent epimerase/dehydratase family protein [Flammeovirga]NLR93944.1 NAD-dependent epimerase/dehydratase family protein [Flammeovirga agarivorans]
MNILVTGTAGFIGYHLTKKLLNEGHTVYGADNINDYYEVSLKYDRLADTGIQKEEIEWFKWVQSTTYDAYKFLRIDLSDKERTAQMFEDFKFDLVIHLAAQAGVRYSLINPQAYIDSNIMAFTNMLEGCKNHDIKKLVYASSSSVYGLNSKVPFSEEDRVDEPISLYAATKKSNELMAHTYTHLYGIQTVGLRFFTVYGPWGRPDMAPMIFSKAVMKNDTIKVFNNGNQSRDFTYIRDIVNGIEKVSVQKIDGTNLVFNIGNGKPVNLLHFIETLESEFNTVIDKDFVEAQPGDVTTTYADTSKLVKYTNYKAQTSIQEGISQFVKWYKEYYGN